MSESVFSFRIDGLWCTDTFTQTLMKLLFTLPALFLLVNCTADLPSSQSPNALRRAAVTPANTGGLQHIINVSAYDPKERSRSGWSYSEHDVTSLRANGAKGLIARAGKGGNLDEKCGSFIKAADRAGLLAGVYYRVQKHMSARRQADQFVDRAQSLSRGRSAGAAPLLLCGDYDGDLSLSAILAFQDRVEQRTGVVPVAYLENSQDLKLKMRAADRGTKSRLRRAPYWLALYSHESGKTSNFSPPGSPEALVDQYAVWPTWTIWQYGGVSWENRRSNAKVYSHGRYRFPKYFGSMDRVLERNVFKGSYGSLVDFWNRHGMR